MLDPSDLLGDPRHEIVLDMTQGLNIAFDNFFFTSHKLGQELLKGNIKMVGMVQKNKPEF